VGRQRRDRHAEESSINTAADRLLAESALSSSGKLTVSALITESGLRRDVVYEHATLVEAFKTRVTTRQSMPLAMRQLTDQHAEANRLVAALKAELTAERAAVARIRKLAAELSLELQDVREQLARSGNVVSFGRTSESGATNLMT
jgi:hypothetical protein